MRATNDLASFLSWITTAPEALPLPSDALGSYQGTAGERRALAKSLPNAAFIECKDRINRGNQDLSTLARKLQSLLGWTSVDAFFSRLYHGPELIN